jgi:hypothetical protein
MNFLIDPKEYLNDPRVRSLNFEQEGILLRLICYKMMDQEIPDHKEVKAIADVFFKDGKIDCKWIRSIRGSGLKSGKRNQQPKDQSEKKLISELVDYKSDSSLSIVKAFWDLFVSVRTVNGKFNNKSLKEAKVGDWLDHLDKMIRIDNRSLDDIRKVYHYMKTEKRMFWATTISSMAAVREKFDKITDSANREIPKKSEEVKRSGNLNDLLNKDYGKVY